MKNTRSIPSSGCYVAAALALITIATGCQPKAAPVDRSAEKSPEKQPTVHIGVVRAEPMEQKITLPATVSSDEQAMLMARVEAYVEEVLVDIGDEVEAGQVLVRLTAPELEHQATQQRLAISHLKASDLVMQAELEAAHSQLDQRQAELTLKNSQRDRLSRLVQSGAIAPQRLEEAEADAKSAAAVLARYKKEVQVAEARLLQGEAQLAVVQASLAEAAAMAAYLEIKSPFAGVVSSRNVDAGNLVQPAGSEGSKSLLVIDKVNQLRAVIHATVDVAGKISVGNPTDFIADDAPGVVHQAKLSRTAGTYDERTRMMRAEIDLANASDPDTGLRPLRAGSYGAATIVVRSATLPVVPESALRTRDGRSAVVVVRNGKCLITPVEIAIRSDGLVGIGSGVDVGDKVIVQDPDQFKDEQQLSDREIEEDEAW